jgi:hypothetical protein
MLTRLGIAIAALWTLLWIPALPYNPTATLLVAATGATIAIAIGRLLQWVLTGR